MSLKIMPGWESRDCANHCFEIRHSSSVLVGWIGYLELFDGIAPLALKRKPQWLLCSESFGCVRGR